MTLIRSAAVSARVAPKQVAAPSLTRRSNPAALSTAARDLLRRSEGNDVSIATFKASPAQLTAFSKNVSVFKEWLFKTGMRISSEIPTSNVQEHSVTKFKGSSVSKAIFDFAEVPSTWPENDESRANRAAALADAKVLAQQLHRNGGELWEMNWNNVDDTNVNILAAVNRKAGTITFVKLFPSI